MSRQITIKDYKTKWLRELHSLYPQRESISIFNRLAAEWLGWSRLELALEPNRLLEEEVQDQLDGALRRIQDGEPPQYILGVSEFCGLRLKVNRSVLIPRPETEELVHWILREQPSSGQKILDIGTGSGCIPIALAHFLPQNQFWGVDVSQKALALARKNARMNGVEVNFSKLNILQPSGWEEKLDCIVSNPPYVRRSEKSLMHKNVLEYEPELALFVKDEDALLFYRKILDFAERYLKKGGAIYFEINEFLEADLQDLLTPRKASEIIFKKDGFGKTRMLKVILV